MKARWIPVTVLTMALSFLVGLGGGSTAETNQAAAQDIAAAAVQTTIAVVNADAGATVDGNQLNYAAAIIDTLSTDFILVSPTMAEKGFDNGTYGAVVTFPTDTSAKVLSFNSQRPQKVEVDFQINPNLSQKNYLDTYIKAVTLQMSINTTLAGTYVSSIFNQLHVAQDHVNQIFSNDQSDLDALDHLTLTDFTAAIKWDEVPDIPLNTTQADTSRFYQEVGDLAENVSTLYLDSYSAASSYYLNMRTGWFQMTGDIAQHQDDWIDLMSTWSQTHIDYRHQLDVFLADLMISQGELDAWFEALLAWSQELADYQTGVERWYQSLRVWFGNAEDWYDQYQAYVADAVAYTEEVTQYRATLANAVDPIQGDLQAWNLVLNQYAASLQTLVSELTQSFQDSNDQRALLNSFLDSLTAWNTTLTGHQAGVVSWRAELQNRKTELQSTVDTMNNLRDHIEGLPPLPDPNVEPYLGNPGLYAAAMETWFTTINDFGSTIPNLLPLANLPDGPANIAPFSGNVPAPLPPLGLQMPTPPPAYGGTQVPNDLAQQFPEPTTALPQLSDLGAPPMDPNLQAPTQVATITHAAILQPTSLQTAPPPAPQEMWITLDQMHSQLSSFDVDAYLTDDIKQQVAVLLNGYQNYLGTVRDDLSTQFDANIARLVDAHTGYGTYLSTLQAQALQTEANEQANLRRALAEYTLIKKENSEDTKERLQLFASVMPESRSPAGVNGDLVGFAVDPLQFIAPDTEAKQSPETKQSLAETYWGYAIIAAWIVLGVFLGTLLSQIWSWRRRKRLTEGTVR